MSAPDYTTALKKKQLSLVSMKKKDSILSLKRRLEKELLFVGNSAACGDGKRKSAGNNGVSFLKMKRRGNTGCFLVYLRNIGMLLFE